MEKLSTNSMDNARCLQPRPRLKQRVQTSYSSPSTLHSRQRKWRFQRSELQKSHTAGGVSLSSLRGFTNCGFSIFITPKSTQSSSTIVRKRSMMILKDWQIYSFGSERTDDSFGTVRADGLFRSRFLHASTVLLIMVLIL
jgi:hypothetical protein